MYVSVAPKDSLSEHSRRPRRPEPVRAAVPASDEFGRAWRAFLAAVFWLRMTPEQLAPLRQHTGRTEAPTAPVRKSWVVVGRRGGKSRLASLLVSFLACFRRYDLAPGERGVAMVAADRRQARVVFRYVAALFDAVLMLAAFVTSRTSEALHLANGISVEVHTASFRGARLHDRRRRARRGRLRSSTPQTDASTTSRLAFWPIASPWPCGS